jgi:hypothetical protein
MAEATPKASVGSSDARETEDGRWQEFEPDQDVDGDDSPWDQSPARIRHRLALQRLDEHQKKPIPVLTHLRAAPNGRASRPRLFLASDRHEYWIKTRAQRGLFPEYAIGQLAAKVGAGPLAELMSVSANALPLDGSLGRFEGVFVGSMNVPGALNLDELAELIVSGALDGPYIDPWSRARVVTFQTWVNATDEQVLIRLEDGVVLSVDHGDCFSTLPPGPPSRIVVTSIPGVSDTVGREWKYVARALDEIMALTDHDILSAVAGLKDLDRWQAPFERRLAAARWLIKRQQRLGEEMIKWAPRLS